MDKAEVLQRGIAAMMETRAVSLWQAGRFSAMLCFLNTAFISVADDLARQISLPREQVDERLRAIASPLRVALLMHVAARQATQK